MKQGLVFFEVEALIEGFVLYTPLFHEGEQMSFQDIYDEAKSLGAALCEPRDIPFLLENFPREVVGVFYVGTRPYLRDNRRAKAGGGFASSSLLSSMDGIRPYSSPEPRPATISAQPDLTNLHKVRKPGSKKHHSRTTNYVSDLAPRGGRWIFRKAPR